MSYGDIDQLLGGIAAQYPVIGAALLRHETIRGAAISFRDRPFLVELYHVLAVSDSVVISKAPQVGITELLMQLAFHEAGWQGRIVGYVLPTQDHRNRFVETRIDKALSEVPAYRMRLPRADQAAVSPLGVPGARLEPAGKGQRKQRTGASDDGSRKVKKLGAGLMLFLSAKTDGDFVEFSADTMIIDEYDLCVAQSADNVNKARDRTRESPKPRIIKLGNPESTANGSIDRMVDEGDCRQWHFRCPHPDCREWQHIDWLENMVHRPDGGAWRLRDEAAMEDDTLDPRPVCRKCARPFERGFEGAWVPLHPGPGRELTYRIARWDSLRQPMRQAWNEWLEAQASTDKLRIWWRGWAGKAWEPVIGSVSTELITDAAILDPMDYEGGEAYRHRAITAGMDVGNDLHIVLSELVRGPHGRVERRGVWAGVMTEPEHALDLWQRYHVKTVVIDAGPERRMSKALADAAGKVGISAWLCDFSNSEARATGEDWAMFIDWKKGRLTVDRTQVMDAAFDCMRLGAEIGRLVNAGELPPDPGADGARLWPMDIDCVFGFIAQMKASKRMFKNNRIVWDEGGKPDHFRLADLYDLIAMVMHGRGAQVVTLRGRED